MELLRVIELRLGRWLAYADSCVNAESELTRCQGFWAAVVWVFVVIGVGLVAGVTAGMMRERRARRMAGGEEKYTRQ